jgi:hypothetical protein
MWCLRAISSVVYWGPSIGLTLLISSCVLPKRLHYRQLIEYAATDGKNEPKQVTKPAGFQIVITSALSGLLAAAAVFVIFIWIDSYPLSDSQKEFYPKNWHRRTLSPVLAVGYAQYEFPWFAWLLTNSVASMVYSVMLVRSIKKGNRGLVCDRCGYLLFGATSPRCPECGAERAGPRARVQNVDGPPA